MSILGLIDLNNTYVNVSLIIIEVVVNIKPRLISFIVAGMRWKVQKRQLTNTKRNKICPRCGGPAMWSMWESNGESE